MNAPDSLPIKSISLLRRLAIIFYECWLLFAVLFLAGFIVLPLTQGQATPLYSLYLLTVIYLYFAWQWRRGGQTLAMKTWHVRLENLQGGRVSWRQTVVRFFTAILSWACLGLGFWWAIFDREKRTWHDILSETRLVKRERS